MSILIKGMKMPTSCAECYFLVERFTGNDFVNECDLQWCDGRCREQVDEECEMHTRSETCPLVEVPTPHGRLIDADRLKRQVEGRLWKARDKFVELIDNAPTIIEAEEGADE